MLKTIFKYLKLSIWLAKYVVIAVLIYYLVVFLNDGGLEKIEIFIDNMKSLFEKIG